MRAIKDEKQTSTYVVETSRERKRTYVLPSIDAFKFIHAIWPFLASMCSVHRLQLALDASQVHSQ